MGTARKRSSRSRLVQFFLASNFDPSYVVPLIYLEGAAFVQVELHEDGAPAGDVILGEVRAAHLGRLVQARGLGRDVTGLQKKDAC